MKRTLILLSLAAIVGASACGSSTSATPTSPTTSSADVTIGIQGQLGAQSFSPSPTTVKVGQTVAWHNNDSITHTATADASAFNTSNVSPGATSAPVMMSTAGTFTYHCSIHPGMIGSITVQ